MNTDFWEHHGWFFLFGMSMFPRITMLIVGTVSGFGLLGLFGWLFVPHLTVAVLATNMYWQTNPILCIIAWIMAFSGTSGEISAQHVSRKKLL